MSEKLQTLDDMINPDKDENEQKKKESSNQ